MDEEYIPLNDSVDAQASNDEPAPISPEDYYGGYNERTTDGAYHGGVEAPPPPEQSPAPQEAQPLTGYERSGNPYASNGADPAVAQAWDQHRFRQAMQEAQLRDPKRQWEEATSGGEFSSQDAARMQRLGAAKGFLEGEVGSGAISYQDGLKALKQINDGLQPLQQRKAATEEAAKSKQYNAMMQDSQFRAMVDEQHAQVQAEDAMRHFVQLPNGDHVYTGKGHYFENKAARDKQQEFDPSKARKLARDEADMLTPPPKESTPESKLAREHEVHKMAEKIYQQRATEFQAKQSGNQPGPTAADTELPRMKFQRDSIMGNRTPDQLTAPEREQVQRLTQKIDAKEPPPGFDQLSANAAPNPNPNQAANEYAAIQRAYPGGASTIKDQRLIQRVVQLRRIMGR